MRNLTIIPCFISLIFSATINIPSDYQTIQAGINASQEGDTVLVSEGLYSENLVLNKEITLASHAIHSDLSNDWLSNGFIQETVIDGGFIGSCLIISNGNIQPKIIGFTFRSGSGTSMRLSNCDINSSQKSGGAILIYKAYPTINYNRFLNNGTPPQGGLLSSPPVANGGAISHFNDDDVEFDEDRNNHICQPGVPCPYQPNPDNHSSRDIPGVMNIQFNYFEDNGSGNGESFYSRGFEGSIDVSGSIFENMDCETGSVNDFILHSTDDDATYIQNDIQGDCIVDNTYYVDPVDGIDSNIGSENSPFKTIGHALTLVKTSESITTIMLAEGTYARLINGESFPLVLPDKVHLIGAGRESTILDADANQNDEAAVIIIPEVEGVYVSGLTMANAYTEGHGCTGGGALLITANDMENLDWEMVTNDAVIENVIIENSHSHNGGGISLFRVDGPTLNNVIVRNNVATMMGGGINVYVSNVTMTNVEVYENTCIGTYYGGFQNVGHGGGIFLNHSSGTMDQMYVHDNTASMNGGGVWSSAGSDWVMSNSTIEANIAPYNGGGFGFWDHDEPQEGSEALNATLINVDIIDNVAQQGWGVGHGGGLWAYKSSTVFEGCNFIGNVSYNNGGAANFWGGGSPVFKNTFFEGNSASASGGAVLIGEDAVGFSIQRCIFINNSSNNNGAAVSAGASGTIGSSTFYGNTTNQEGAINIYNNTTSIDIYNSIIWNNNMQYQIAGYAGNTNLSHSNVKNGTMYGGVNNIYSDPMFTNIFANDFTLDSNSPCIDAGVIDYDNDWDSDVDYYYGIAPDMGAHEFLVAAEGLQIYTANSSVILAWNPFEGAQYYTLERATDSLFTTNVTSNFVNVNTYTDTDIEFDTHYYYRVAAYAGYLTGWSNVVSVILESASISDVGQIPTSFAMHQNFPNPFNPTTIVRYDLPEDGLVNIIVYDMMGRIVRTLVNDYQSSGYKTVQWDATNDFGNPVSAGVYLYQIHADSYTQTKKMILLK